jgi:FG-GAP-like repeat
MWLLLASLLSLQAASAPSAPSLPDGARVLFTVDGNKHDHLGKGLLDLGDVDGDHIPDFLVGAVCGVPGLTQGRGYALVCSGKDGHVLRRFQARDDQEGIAYAGVPSSIGDVDGDGVSEIALDAQPSIAADICPYVEILSPKLDSPLHVFTGPLNAREGLRSVEGALGVGDLDADGKREIAVWSCGDRTWLFSSPWDAPRFEMRGCPIGSTSDLDGDGVRDLILLTEEKPDSRGPRTGSARLYSGKDGHLLRSWIAPASPRGTLYWETGLGDLDRDGVPDVMAVTYARADGGGRIPAEETQFDCAILSGRDGKQIHAWCEALDGVGHITEVAGLPDLDGDGVPEFVLSRAVESCAPHGRMRIFSGKTRAVLRELTSANWSFGGRVRPMSDLDGDGLPELLVSEHEYGDCAGRAWVISLGKLTGAAPK